MSRNISTIFMAGDSTMQSYSPDMAPQAGWGQLFYQYFYGWEEGRIYWPREVEFTQVRRYELPGLAIENHAMAGRSSRSFREEGRLAAIAARIRQGDYLLVEFAHNDAYREKAERYVAAADFGASLMPYVEVCRQAGAVCVLITPIVMRDIEENEGEWRLSFPEYREAMITLAQKEKLPLLDLDRLSMEYCQHIGSEAAKRHFLWTVRGAYPDSRYADGSKDNAHLQVQGADAFAGLAAAAIKAYKADKRLDALKEMLI